MAATSNVAGQSKFAARGPRSGRGRVQCILRAISTGATRLATGAKVGRKISGPDERFKKRCGRREHTRRQWQGGCNRRFSRRFARCLFGGDGDERRRPAGCGSGTLGSLRFRRIGLEVKRVIQRKIENYVGSSNPEAIRKASPITYVDASVSPLYVVASDDETMPPRQLLGSGAQVEASGRDQFQTAVPRRIVTSMRSAIGRT